MTSAFSEAGSLALPEQFICTICFKSFKKELSRNRHIPYCQKRDKRKYSREKACMACSKAKVKCSFSHPCQRCTVKKISCFYEAPSRSGYGPVSGTRGRHSRVAPAVSSPATNRGTGKGFPFEPLESDIDCNQGSHYTVDVEELGLLDTSNIILQQPVDLEVNMQQLAPSLESHGQVFTDAEPSLDFIFDDYELVNVHPPATSLVKGLPIPRSQIVLISSILRTYPKMMLRRNTLPPYIHLISYASSRLSDDTNGPLPGPLEFCIKIAHMFAARNSETSDFLWRTIEKERIRFMTELHDFSQEEVLAALQCMGIYVIMRMVNGTSTEYDNSIDILIMGNLSQRFNELCPGPFSPHESHGARPSWRQWIFEESRRRMATGCFLLNLVISGLALPEFRMFPVCSSKALWEAKTEDEWRDEYELSRLRYMEQTRLRTLGDLMDVQRLREEGDQEVLDEWNMGVDGLGMLLTVATAPC